MSIAFSSIAWDPSEDDAVAAVLREEGVEAVELAPTKIWADLTEVPRSEALAMRSSWERRGFPIVALQATLFGRSDLRVFGTAAERRELLCYLDRVFELAERLGAPVLVFGSPRNRQRGARSLLEAGAIARQFFAEAAERAAARQVVLCIEPNPEQYDCDFVTTTQAGVDLVDSVGHPGFRLHLDAACMTLADDPVGESIQRAVGMLCHFHASEPQLVPLGDGAGTVAHAAVAAALTRAGYQRFVSVEMRPPAAEPLSAIRRAASFAVRTYLRGR